MSSHAGSEYWCDVTILVSIIGPNKRTSFRVNKPFARIGSHPEAEIRLQGEGIESCSLYLHATDQGILCLKVSASLEEGTLRGSRPSPLDTITLGEYQIRVQCERSDTPSRPSAEQQSEHAASLPVFHISAGRKEFGTRRFRAGLSVIGKCPEAALQLNGKKVAMCHAVLVWQKQCLWFIDLLSNHRTLFNETPMGIQRLELNQSIQVGEFQLLFQRLSKRTTASSAAPASASSSTDLLSLSPVTSIAVTPSAQGVVSLSPSKEEAPPVVAVDSAMREREAHLLATISQQREEIAKQLTSLKHEREAFQQERLVWEKQLATHVSQWSGQQREWAQQWALAMEELSIQKDRVKEECHQLSLQREELVTLRAGLGEQQQELTETIRRIRDRFEEQLESCCLFQQQQTTPQQKATFADCSCHGDSHSAMLPSPAIIGIGQSVSNADYLQLLGPKLTPPPEAAKAPAKVARTIAIAHEKVLPEETFADLVYTTGVAASISTKIYTDHDQLAIVVADRLIGRDQEKSFWTRLFG